MNVIKVYGGLGNQLFQYAFGKAQMLNGLDVRFDTSWYMTSQEPPRPYCLDKFYTNVPESGFKGSNRMINEVKLNYVNDPEMLKMDKCNFYGYWQHPGYYTEVMSKLKDEFRVKKEFYTDEYVKLKEKIICNDSVSMHVRRGDYISINGHHLLTKDYYSKVISMLRDKGDVYVFSDDIPWCKTQFRNVTFIELGIEYLEFELMRLCKHNGISNSTFSWWAATLNDNPDKVIITPKKWRVKESEQAKMDERLFLPVNWVQL
jgi:hypothetical protein